MVHMAWLLSGNEVTVEDRIQVWFRVGSRYCSAYADEYATLQRNGWEGTMLTEQDMIDRIMHSRTLYRIIVNPTPKMEAAHKLRWEI